VKLADDPRRYRKRTWCALTLRHHRLRLAILVSRSSSTAVARIFALGALCGIVLCAGCIGPFACHRGSPSCGAIVDQGSDCGPDGCNELCCADECGQCPPGDPCCTVPSVSGIPSTAAACVCSCTGTAWCWVEPLVCWPQHKCGYLLNFCAPDGYVGPPDTVGPGRFHPVPTHPVFFPGSCTAGQMEPSQVPQQ
jgi:hypothetical protein